VTFWDAPTLPSGKAGSSARIYDEQAMVAVVRHALRLAPVCGVVIEQVHAMPGQGVTSMFSMGEGYGLWKGIVSACGLAWGTVTPQAWKKVVLAGYGNKDKGAAVQVASRLFPSVASQLKTERGRILDGRADALCIAEYLRRMVRR
jgi:crossover junction endodeoxyribonuclease RuvC